MVPVDSFSVYLEWRVVDVKRKNLVGRVHFVDSTGVHLPDSFEIESLDTVVERLWTIQITSVVSRGFSVVRFIFRM